MLEDRSDFDTTVRDELSSILNRTYRTVRRGGHFADKDEFLRDRRFWPDMHFHGVAERQTSNGLPGLAIMFSPVAAAGQVYGFKVDLDQSLAAWSKRIGIMDPREHPSMFAAELIWFMVTYIGAVDIDAFPTDASGVRWINSGSEIFEGLPGNAGHHH